MLEIALQATPADDSYRAKLYDGPVAGNAASMGCEPSVQAAFVVRTWPHDSCRTISTLHKPLTVAPRDPICQNRVHKDE